MKIRDIMTDSVVKIHPEETVAVAARTLAHYNIGILPVCGGDGRVCGLVTDRDLVTRCMAAGRSPENTRVREVMTGQVVSAQPDMDTGAAAHLMGRQQIRRLPVVENGRLCGMVSLGDLANRDECNPDAADALGDICANISDRS
ncbi:MAG: CBS domain-containing protein [Firmicutes bacterium]|nr:CBS domain-containing protein [Bacillota bacterium]